MENINITSSNKKRLAELWNEGCRTSNGFPHKDEERWVNDTLYCNEFSYDGSGNRRDDAARQTCLGEFYNELLRHASVPNTHFALLEAALSKLLVCQFKTESLDPVLLNGGSATTRAIRNLGKLLVCQFNRKGLDPVALNVESATTRAVHILSKLPALPPKIELTSPDRLLSEYMIKNTSIDGESANSMSSWDKLLVVSSLHDSILKLALLVTTRRPAWFSIGHSIRSFVNLVSELIDLSSQRTSSGDEDDILRHNILKSFLWATWQRSLMLFMWSVLKTHLDLGYDKDCERLLALRGCSELTNPSVQSNLYGGENQSHPYMCRWAFEQLRSNRASLGLDFRRFHERFSALHETKLGRCRYQSDDPCDGDHPLSCGRFKDKRLVKEEQSFHDEQCSGTCQKVAWDKESYLAVQGPTAASFDTVSGKIMFTQAGEKTMAISHVWSHGQGSRPNIGINECLHQKYSRIAREQGCENYWFDSICIPDSHDLRQEAIGFINLIFATSKITLVCDKDLMAIDISNATTDLLESILVTFLVCDWNVRAWTLLEAMKGSHAIHLLFQSDKIMSLREILLRIHQDGSVDIGILCLTAQNLLPSSIEAFRRRSSRQGMEVGGNLLSYRHATREGDDIVIWSLLSGTRVFNDAEEMWRSKMEKGNQEISTAYLISNTPRFETVRGLSWAPKTPYIRKPDHGSTKDMLGPYNPFEGSDSEPGLMTSRGLEAGWMVYNFTKGNSPPDEDALGTNITISASGERVEETVPDTRVKNRCWELAMSLHEKYKHVIFIQPKTMGKSRAYDGATNRGESHGHLFAICTSDDKIAWTWRAVQAWPREVPMPHFVFDRLLIE